jgi:hypothetical protein
MQQPSAKPSALLRWRKLVLRLVLILICTYVAIIVLLKLFEDSLVYHPTPATAFWAPLPAGARDVMLKSAAGDEIHSWWLPCPGSTGALLYFHGNAGNLSQRRDTIVRLRDTLGLSVHIIDYPGFGKSPGTPSEQACYRAADAAYSWLVDEQKIAPAEIVLLGNSLGGGVATELASRHDHRVLCLVKTYTSLPDVGSHLYPWLPVRLLMHNRFDSLSRIADCHRPVFVAHGTADELIPFALGKRLYEAAHEPKQFLVMPGLGHNDAFPDEFYAALKEFLGKHPASASGER